MGRLGSGVWVSVSFQIFALKVGEMSKVGMKIVREGNVWGNMSEVGIPGVNIL